MNVARLRFHRSAELILWGLVAVYVMVIAWMAVTGSYFFVRKSAIVPVFCAAALLSHRLGPFLRDWVPFLGWTLVFDALRGLAFALVTRFDLPVFMGYAVEWERALLGGALLPTALQQVWRDAPSIGWLERAAIVLHASHFVFFLGLGFLIWHRRPAHFSCYVAVVLAVMFVGLLVYVLVPTVPPWMAAREFGVIPPVERIGMWVYNAHLPRLTNALATNPVAAMPSLHAAFPAAGAAVALHLFGPRAWWTVGYAVAVAGAVGYLGEHYLVDVAAGWALALVAYTLAFRRRESHPVARPRSLARAIVWGIVLFAASEAASALKGRIERPFVPTTAFIERELAGRTVREPYYRGLRAERDGDLAAAVRFLTEARDRAATEAARAEADDALRRVVPPVQ